MRSGRSTSSGSAPPCAAGCSSTSAMSIAGACHPATVSATSVSDVPARKPSSRARPPSSALEAVDLELLAAPSNHRQALLEEVAEKRLAEQVCSRLVGVGRGRLAPRDRPLLGVVITAAEPGEGHQVH